ncbi:MAG: RidA family protein [Mucinivorans sp.]
MKKIISSSFAPAAVGPYSQAVLSGDTLYVSGQLPIDPSTGKMAVGIQAQTKQSLANTDAILREAGFSRGDVVKSTVLLDNLDDFAAMNAVYGEFYGEPYPARVAYEVVRLPLGAMVEIETIAVR